MRVQDIEVHNPRHQAEHGNLVRDIIPVIIRGGWAADDVIPIQENAWDTIYTSMRVVRAGGSDTATGLTVDLGYENMEDGSTNDTEFSTDTAADATNIAAAELLTDIYEMRESKGKGVRHRLTARLGGTVTVGKKFFVVVDRIFVGSN